jgi:hypothetical protein
MGFYDAFFGSDQSLYTAYAIIAAIIAICLTILLTSTDIPIGNRFLIVFFVIITLVPSIFLTLFELTCIVTGGTEPNRWWCHAFAWILAAFIIIYCIIVVIMSLVSLFNYNKAIDSINNDEQKYKVSNNDSNNYAKEIINQTNNKPVEKFEPNIPDPFSIVSNINDITSVGPTIPGIDEEKEKVKFETMLSSGYNPSDNKKSTDLSETNNANSILPAAQIPGNPQSSGNNNPTMLSTPEIPSVPPSTNLNKQDKQELASATGLTSSTPLRFSNFNSSESFDTFDDGYYSLANFNYK